MPRMSWLPGHLTIRRLLAGGLAVAVALLLVASPPAARGTVAPFGPVEEPAPPGEDREDAPDTQPTFHLSPIRLSSPSPGDRRAGHRPFRFRPSPHFSLASPAHAAAPFGAGVCFRLRC